MSIEDSSFFVFQEGYKLVASLHNDQSATSSTVKNRKILCLISSTTNVFLLLLSTGLGPTGNS